MLQLQRKHDACKADSGKRIAKVEDLTRQCKAAEADAAAAKKHADEASSSRDAAQSEAQRLAALVKQLESALKVKDAQVFPRNLGPAADI